MSSAVAVVEEQANSGFTKSSRLRKALAIGAAVLMLALGGGLWFSGFLRHPVARPAKTQSAQSSGTPILIEIPDIVTNLDAGTHRPVFVKLKSRIEVVNAADEAVIISRMPQILDAFQMYLRSTRPEELHGGEGTYRLRESLMNRIDIIASPVQVVDVLFIEILVQ